MIVLSMAFLLGMTVGSILGVLVAYLAITTAFDLNLKRPSEKTK